jgi:hypothetical protein
VPTSTLKIIVLRDVAKILLSFVYYQSVTAKSYDLVRDRLSRCKIRKIASSNKQLLSDEVNRLGGAASSKQRRQKRRHCENRRFNMFAKIRASQQSFVRRYRHSRRKGRGAMTMTSEFQYRYDIVLVLA